MAGRCPRRTLKMKPVPLVDDDQLAALLKACAGKDFNETSRDEALIRLMLGHFGVAGVSEACGLRLRPAGPSIRAWRSSSGKGAKVRPVYFGARTTRALDRYLRARTSHRWAHLDALFLTQRGRVVAGWGTGAGEDPRRGWPGLLICTRTGSGTRSRTTS